MFGDYLLTCTAKSTCIPLMGNTISSGRILLLLLLLLLILLRLFFFLLLLSPPALTLPSDWKLTDTERSELSALMQGPRASKVAKVAHPASAAGISTPVAAASSSAPAAVKCTNRSHPSRSAAVTQRPHASLTARVEALRRIDNPSTTLSRLIVNLEAGNPHLAIPESGSPVIRYIARKNNNTASSGLIETNEPLLPPPNQSLPPAVAHSGACDRV